MISFHNNLFIFEIAKNVDPNPSLNMLTGVMLIIKKKTYIYFPFPPFLHIFIGGHTSPSAWRQNPNNEVVRQWKKTIELWRQ